MSRNRSTILLSCVAVLMLAACHSPRKAGERACRKAERHKARAVWLCPQILSLDSASITFKLPGDSAAKVLSYSDPILDSVMADCEQLREALAAERDLYQVALAMQTERLRKLNAPDSTPARAQKPAQDAVDAAARMDHLSKAAIAQLREDLCAFEPFDITAGLCTCKIRPGKLGPLVTVTQADVEERATVPCPPQVGHVPCPEPGVAPWYRWAFWVLVLIIIGRYVLRIISKGMLSNLPHG